MLIGHVTRAAVGTCRVGSLTFLREKLPWHITYSNFLGGLPAISSVRWVIRNVAWLIQQLISCLYEASGAAPGWNVELRLGAAGRVESVVFDESLTIPSTNCAFEIPVRGTGAMTVLGSATPITVRLI